MGLSFSTARRARPSHKIAALALLAASALAAHGEGLSLHSQENASQARSPTEYALTNTRATASAIRMLGDYYFFDPSQSNLSPLLGSLVGGLRASTGLVGLAQPLPLYEARPESLQSLPYVGLGYSHFWFNSQLSLNADVGMENGRGHGLFGNAATLDDVTNQVRWAPVMAVNARYSF